MYIPKCIYIYIYIYICIYIYIYLYIYTATELEEAFDHVDVVIKESDTAKVIVDGLELRS
jgi:hypothetical protein